MADYKDLYTLINESELINRVNVAVLAAARDIFTENVSTTNHDNRLKWAKWVYKNPKEATRQIYWTVVMANRGLSIDTIKTALDGNIQTNVDSVVDIFADGSQT